VTLFPCLDINYGKTARRKIRRKIGINNFEGIQFLYPWSSKIPKAVWRGSTTGYLNKHPTLESYDFSSLLRARLVKIGMENSHMIDAAFHKLVQSFAGQEKEIQKHTRISEKIQFEDFMNFKAVIDIDGNTWSERFSALLCTNSVVIKLCFEQAIKF